MGSLSLTCCILQNGLAHIAVLNSLQTVVGAVNTGNEDLTGIGQQTCTLQGFHSTQSHLVVCTYNCVEIGLAARSVSLNPSVADTHCFVLNVIAVLVSQNGDVIAACFAQSILEALTAVSGVLQTSGACQIQNLSALRQVFCHVLALHVAGS